MDGSRDQSLFVRTQLFVNHNNHVVRLCIYAVVSMIMFFGPLSAMVESPAASAKTTTPSVQMAAAHYVSTQPQSSVSVAPVLTGAMPSQTPEPRMPDCHKVSPISAAGVTLNGEGFVAKHDAPQYYQVYGTGLRQVRAQLEQCSPEGYFGYTAYRLTWDYRTVWNADGTCSIANIGVGIHTIIQYPAWQGNDVVLQQQWNKMMNNLALHEQGHVMRSETVARELYDAMNALESVSCRTINDQATTLTLQYSNKLQQVHTQYDDSTAHGFTQGAVL